MPKPLPNPTLKPNQTKKTTTEPNKSGILLGDNVYWNPCVLPNGHIAIIGASGSGKTQTLKAIAYELPRFFPSVKIITIDFHGDQELPGERYYPLNMESPHGINPLVVDLDTKGGGPSLQAIAVSAILKKALTMGINQEGLAIDILTTCYKQRGIIQDEPATWKLEPPTFADVRQEIEARIEDGCKESSKLALKLAAMFEYGIFTRPQPSLDAQIIRFDLSALGKVPGLGAIAAEALIKQIMDSHRIMGEIEGKIPKSYIFIDECKEVKTSRTLNIILADGRKYGLGAVVASQSDKEISDEVIANSASKIVLGVDQTEVKRVSKRFRFAESLVGQLQPLEALVRMGTIGERCKIKAFYERIE
jgi:type IV secretory pathway VirB4 component